MWETNKSIWIINPDVLVHNTYLVDNNVARVPSEWRNDAERVRSVVGVMEIDLTQTHC